MSAFPLPSDLNAYSEQLDPHQPGQEERAPTAFPLSWQRVPRGPVIC